MHFRYDGSKKISIVEPYIGKSGELQLSQFTIESLDQIEDHLIFSAVTSDGEILDQEVTRRLFDLQTELVKNVTLLNQSLQLSEHLEQRKTTIQKTVKDRNVKFFEAEAEKLDNWSEDLKIALEREIKDMDKQIREIKRSTIALNLEEKLAGQKQIRTLERSRTAKRKALFEAQDEIDRKRDAFIQEIEGKLAQSTNCTELFAIKWRLL